MKLAGLVSAVANTAMDAIVIVDENLDISFINSAAERMFGYAAGGVIGRSVLELVPGTGSGELRGTLEQALRMVGDEPRVMSSGRYAAGRRSDGTAFPVDLSVSRTRVDRRAFVTIAIRDVTEWKRAQEIAEWQRRVLEAIATGVELQDVLASIARFHETQCPNADCAIYLIDNNSTVPTLRLACAPSMRPEFVADMKELEVDPRSSMCGMVAYRREQIITPDIAIDELWPDRDAVAALEVGYRAWWAMPIRARHGQLLGVMAVYSRNRWVPSEDALRVTASATQLGAIALERAPEGQSANHSYATPSFTPAVPGPRILIIDDEAPIRAALRRFFTRRGWQVDEAIDGSEALSTLLSSKSEYTAVISDLNMPGCSGIELHDHVAAIAPELLDRLVFSTGDVSSPDSVAFLQRTQCTVIRKPFQLRALEATLSRLKQPAVA